MSNLGSETETSAHTASQDEKLIDQLYEFAKSQSAVSSVLIDQVRALTLINRHLICALWEQLPIDEMRANVIEVLSKDPQPNAEAVSVTNALFHPIQSVPSSIPHVEKVTPADLRKRFRLVDGGSNENPA